MDARHDIRPSSTGSSGACAGTRLVGTSVRRLPGGAPPVVRSCNEYGGNPAGDLSLTRELRWASEIEGMLLKFVVVDKFGAIVEKRSEVDGAPMTFIPVSSAPDGVDPIPVEVLVSEWLVGVAVRLIGGYL